MEQYKTPISSDSDALAHAPTFDEMVGLIEKNFKDVLELSGVTEPDRIADAWRRYKTLNHLYQDTQPPSNTAVPSGTDHALNVMDFMQPMPRPIGEFILAQEDIKPVMSDAGGYYHYSDVCTLLNRYNTTSTPQGAVSGSINIEMERKLAATYMRQGHYVDLHEQLLRLLKDWENLPQGADWVKVSKRLPELVGKKASPHHVRVEVQTHGGGTYLRKQTAYYFPEHFQSVEWEDWDDYSQEDFPYTKEDTEKGIVWLRAGWYSSIDCDKCEGYWSAPLNVIEWLDESGASNQSDTVELLTWIKESNLIRLEDGKWAKWDNGKAIYRHFALDNAQLYDIFKKR